MLKIILSLCNAITDMLIVHEWEYVLDILNWILNEMESET